MSLLIDQIAERRILKAMEEGQLDDLPGQGEPLNLEDDSMIPEHLRVGYRILKNAGCIPIELEERKDALRLCDLLEQCKEGSNEAAETIKLLRQIELRMKLRGADTRFIYEYLHSHSGK